MAAPARQAPSAIRRTRSTSSRGTSTPCTYPRCSQATIVTMHLKVACHQAKSSGRTAAPIRVRSPQRRATLRSRGAASSPSSHQFKSSRAARSTSVGPFKPAKPARRLARRSNKARCSHSSKATLPVSASSILLTMQGILRMLRSRRRLRSAAPLTSAT